MTPGESVSALPVPGYTPSATLPLNGAHHHFVGFVSNAMNRASDGARARECRIVARKERSEIRGRSPGQIAESRIALRSIRATLAMSYLEPPLSIR
jgi:hypothetical protein